MVARVEHMTDSVRAFTNQYCDTPIADLRYGKITYRNQVQNFKVTFGGKFNEVGQISTEV